MGQFYCFIQTYLAKKFVSLMKNILNLVLVLCISIPALILQSCSDDENPHADVDEDVNVSNNYTHEYHNGELIAKYFYENDQLKTVEGYPTLPNGFRMEYVYGADGKLNRYEHTVRSESGESETEDKVFYYHESGELDYVISHIQDNEHEYKDVYTFENQKIQQITHILVVDLGSGIEEFETGKSQYEYFEGGYTVKHYNGNNYDSPTHWFTYTYFTEYSFKHPVKTVQDAEYYLPWNLIKSYENFSADGTSVYLLTYTHELDKANRLVATYETFPDTEQSLVYTFDYTPH